MHSNKQPEYLAIPDEFCISPSPSPPPPPPPLKVLLVLGVKVTAAIHVPAKPYGSHFWQNHMEVTYGSGFHLRLEMTHLDIPSIWGAEFTWNSQLVR